jgi:hypothetical protein
MQLFSGFPPRRPGFKPRSGHVGFVVDKVALGQVFSEYFGFACQFSFHQLFHIQHHLSSGVCTVGQLVAHVPSGLNLTPPHPKRNHLTSRVNQTPTFTLWIGSSCIRCKVPEPCYLLFFVFTWSFR